MLFYCYLDSFDFVILFLSATQSTSQFACFARIHFGFEQRAQHMHAYECSDKMSPCTALLNTCTVINFWHILYETILKTFRNDFEEKINHPEVIQIGRCQKYFNFV